MTVESDLERLEAEVQHVNKLDVGVLWSVTLSILTFAFGCGLYFGTILEQGRRIDALERDRTEDRREIAEIKQTVVKIDTNVTFLAERAREDRERHGR